MLKQFVIGLFLSFFSFTSLIVLAETANANIKIRTVSLTLNQDDGKYIHRLSKDIDNGEMLEDLNEVKTENAIVKPESNSSEQSGWLLAFALFGFVMLSNRRGV